MTRFYRSCIVIFLLFPFSLLPAFSAAAQEKHDSARWEKEIAAFEASDKTNPPPKNANLFIGSSSIRKWTTLAKDFPKHQVINRGFGGSEMKDSVYFFDRIVAPHHPKMIVVYAGGNDINAHKTPERVLSDFTNFVAKAAKALPTTRIAYISIAPNPARWAQLKEIKAANQLIADFCKTKSNLKFINVFPEMLGPDGLPKPDIYSADKLHMNANGYMLWTKIVGPYLK